MAAIGQSTVVGEKMHSEQRLFDLIQQVEPPNSTTTPLDDEFFDQISAEMKAHGLKETWYSRPRTYFLLSKINNVAMMTSFILQGCDDTSIPYSSQNALPQSELKPWNPFLVQDFMSWQRLCQSERLKLEKGVHCRLDDGNIIFREHGQRLGEGSEMTTIVDRVVSKFTGEVYARKRIARKNFPKEAQRAFQREMRALTRIIEHKHLIRVCGTYTDKKYFALLLQPVADCTLKEYLASSKSKTSQAKTSLWAYFGCMAKVMTILHDQEKILHKDIKGDNFLLYQDRLILTDFGTAFDFSQTDQSMTLANRADARTLRYSSPEVALEGRFHRASDIWSLGIVFLEILTVLCGKTLTEFEVYMKCTHRSSSHVHANQPAALDWLRELQLSDPQEADSVPFTVIPQMLEMAVKDRPQAIQLYSDLCSSQSGRFCGECCREEHSEIESDSDLLSSDEDEQTELPSHQPCVETIGNERDNHIPGSFPLETATYQTHEPSFHKIAPAAFSSYESKRLGNIAQSLPHGLIEAEPCSGSIVSSSTSRTVVLPESARGTHESTSPVRDEGLSRSFSYDESGKDHNASTQSRARITQAVARLALSFLAGRTGPQPRSSRDSRSSKERSSSRSPVAIRGEARLPSRKDTESTSSTLTIQDQRLKHFLTSLPAVEDYDLIEDEYEKYEASKNLKGKIRFTNRVPLKIKSQEDLRSSTELPQYRHEQSSDLLPSLLIRFPSDGNLRERYQINEQSRTRIEAELREFQHGLALPSPRQEELHITPIFEEPESFSGGDIGTSVAPDTIDETHEAGAQEPAPVNTFPQSDRLDTVSVPGSFPGDSKAHIGEDVPLPAIAEARTEDAADELPTAAQAVTSTNVTPDMASHPPAENRITAPHGENPPEYEELGVIPSIIQQQIPPVSERRGSKSPGTSRAIEPLSVFLDAVPLQENSGEKWESVSVYMKRILDDKASVAATSLMSVNTRKFLRGSFTKWHDDYYGYLPYYVTKGKVAAVRWLLSRGCNPGRRDKPRLMPMLNAVRGRTHKHTKCLIALIEHGADTRARDSSGKTYLHHAISQEPWPGYSTTVYVLMMNKVNPNVVDKCGHTPLLSLLIGKGCSTQDSISLLRREERDALMVLLASNFDTDIYKRPRDMKDNVLHLTVMRHDPYVLDALLEKMEEEEDKARLIHEVDRDGYTPLMLALAMCSYSTPDTAQTATRMLELLLQNGANPNDKDPETGDTALHIVLAKQKNIDAFKLLVGHGADPTVRNRENISGAALLHSLVGSERPHSFLASAKEYVSGLEKWKVPSMTMDEIGKKDEKKYDEHNHSSE